MENLTQFLLIFQWSLQLVKFMGPIITIHGAKNSNSKAHALPGPPLLLFSVFWQEWRRYSRSLFRRSTGNNVSGHYFCCYSFIIHFFLPVFQLFFFIGTFSHRRSARMKKLILQKWLKMANNLGSDPFPDPVGHFGAPWRPFWILQVFYVSHTVP